jgi:hypothetical protein
MYRVSRTIGLLVALAILPALAVGQTKTAKVDEASLRAKLLAGGVIDGKFTKLDLAGDEKTLVLTYTYQNRKVKQAGYKKFYDAAVRYNAALDRRNTSLEEITKLKAAADEAAKDAYDIEEINVTFDLKPGDRTLVRTMIFPTDGDGKPKKLSQAEIQKLKGDPKLPGLTAKLADLNKEETVRVTLDKSKIKKGEEVTSYPVSMIVIQAPPPPPSKEEEFKPIVLR